MRDTAAVAQEAAELANRRRDAGDLSAQDALRVEIDSERVAADLQSATVDLERAELALSTFVRRQDLVAARSSAVIWPNLQEPRGDSPTAALTPPLRARGDVRAAQARVEAARASVDGALACASLIRPGAFSTTTPACPIVWSNCACRFPCRSATTIRAKFARTVRAVASRARR